MYKITGNEPACPYDDYYYQEGERKINMSYTGLTIRQQFAMVAMQGVLSGLYSGGSISDKINNLSKKTGDSVSTVISKASLEHADSLINELNMGVTNV